MEYEQSRRMPAHEGADAEQMGQGMREALERLEQAVTGA